VTLRFPTLRLLDRDWNVRPREQGQRLEGLRPSLSPIRRGRLFGAAGAWFAGRTCRSGHVMQTIRWSRTEAELHLTNLDIVP